MAATTTTLVRDRADGSCLEITACERDGSDGLSPGFSVTADLWEARGRLTGRRRRSRGAEPDACGRLHEEILEAAPELAPLVDVHLADPAGLPMHAEANGWYLYSGRAAAHERESIAAGRDYGYSRLLEASDHDRAAGALHVSPDDLPTGLDREDFSAFVASLAARYRDRADRARQVLAELAADETASLATA